MFELSIRHDLPFRSHSRAFILRVWREELDIGCQEWRGQLRDVSTGEARYFRGWPGLISCLGKMLDDDCEEAERRC